MRACASGQTYNHSFLFYRERGARTDYVTCTHGCGVDDNPGPNVTTIVSATFSYRRTVGRPVMFSCPP